MLTNAALVRSSTSPGALRPEDQPLASYLPAEKICNAAI